MVYRIMLVGKFNKLPLIKKLLIIYVAGFLIPIFSVNVVFAYSHHRDKAEFKKINFESSIEKISIILKREIDENLRFIYNLYINQDLNNFLNSRLESMNDFLTAKSKISNIETLSTQLRIQNITVTIYTYNQNIHVSNLFKKIDSSITVEKWYKDFIESDKNVDVYYNPQYPNQFSIIRLLNYQSRRAKNMENILKIDIPVQNLIKTFEENGINQQVRIIGRNNYVVLTKPEYLKKYDEYKFPIEGSLLIQDWYILGDLPKETLFETLFNGKAFLFFILFILVLGGSLLIWYLSKSFYSRILDLTKTLNRAITGEFGTININTKYWDEITQLENSYNLMANKIHDLINEVSESKLREKNIEIVKKRVQLNALRSQINPHYLFNVLESIRMKSLLKNEGETAGIIKHLSKSYRHIISWDNDIITLKEEIEIAKDFLVVQKYRFEDKVNYKFFIEDKLNNLKLPKLSLEPFIENSCIHGIEKSPNNGTIEISVVEINEKIIFTIRDDGIGINQGQLKKLKKNIEKFDLELNHIGFSNAFWRLKNHFPNMVFSIETKPLKGTSIKIEIDKKDCTL
jgi:two-component system, sensor histidine kinase YesM